MSMWRHVDKSLELPIYFCHARSPWERKATSTPTTNCATGSPKRTNICRHPPAFYDRVAFVLNNTPRRLLAWTTAEQRYLALAATH